MACVPIMFGVSLMRVVTGVVARGRRRRHRRLRPMTHMATVVMLVIVHGHHSS
jgi:hypothetical protein